MTEVPIESSPYISICVPVYNAGSYLEQAITRILEQSYTNIELLICDNGSTDRSTIIARDFASHDFRVRFVQNHWNIGYSGNVYKVTSMAKGDFILFHAADDLMESDALENYVKTIEKEPSENRSNLILLSDFYVINTSGEKGKVSFLDPSNRLSSSASLDAYEPSDTVLQYKGIDINKQYFSHLICFGWVGTVMFSRQLYDRVEGYISNHWINPDKFFMYKILSLDPDVRWLRKPLFSYRIHDTNQNSLQAQTGVLKYLLDEYAFTFEFSPDFYEQNSLGKDRIVRYFVEHDCLDLALVKMANGERKLGFRFLSFALATYPHVAWKILKTYVAVIVWLLGPIGVYIARLFYKSGSWTRLLKKSE